MTTLSIICAWAVIAADPTAIAPPTYRLEVGQRIEVTSSEQGLSSFEATDAPDPEAKRTYRWTLRVIDQDDKRGWRIVVRQTASGNTSGVYAIEMVSFWMTPQGVLTWDDSFSGWQGGVDPDALLPRLPTASELLTGSWEQQDVCNAARSTYSTLSANDTVLRLRRVEQTPFLTASSGGSESEFEFDPRDGFVSSMHSKAHFSGDQFYRSTAKLERGESFPLAEARQFLEDWDRWVSALGTLRLAVGGDGLRAACPNGVSTLPAALEAMREAAEHIKSPEIREQAERKLARLDKSADQKTQALTARAALLDQPAPAWTVEDLQGKEHSLSQYRGQVVLLDFWFRECGYCMQLVPQLHRVAESFEGQPFVLLGMNIDEDVEDARVGAETMKPTPVLLHSKEIAKGLGISSYPTLVLIDQEGKIHDVFNGYSRSREADLLVAISRLLSQ